MMTKINKYKKLLKDSEKVKKNLENSKLKNEIQNAVIALKNGGVAVFPTDTVYGIGTLPKKRICRKNL